jgi:hypothetical protein
MVWKSSFKIASHRIGKMQKAICRYLLYAKHQMYYGVISLECEGYWHESQCYGGDISIADEIQLQISC